MKQTLRYIVLLSAGVVVAWPFVWMFGTAFKSLPEAVAGGLWPIPETWQWHNIVDTFRAAPFGRYFVNTFFVAAVVTLVVLTTSVLAGYAFARLPFRGRNLLFLLVLASMMVPFELIFIPNFVLITRLGWYNTYAALIVPWCANAFSIFLMRQAFMTLPSDFFDAARMDGCGHLRFLWRVGLPLVRPAAVTVALFAFLGSYNALLWPLIVTADRDMRVVQVGLTIFQGDAGQKTNLLMCAATVVIAPVLALYFALQRYFIESSLGTGLKG